MRLSVTACVAVVGTASAQVAPITTAPNCTARPTGGDASRPFPVCDVKPSIVHGPYLSAPTDTSATIIWATDIPSHSRVKFGVAGSLDREAFSTRDGMANVGRLHAVRLTGLVPGQRYEYRVASTPVLELTAYWPKKGIEIESPTFAFTTFDRRKATVSFASISDTHASVARIDSLMRKIDWTTTDFLVHTGDAFDGVASEAMLWERWLGPMITGGLRQSTPLIFARGNHDTRGPFARELAAYVSIEEGRFYYARDIGPVHLLALDTGEDKPDSTQVYARLNRMEEYRRQELDWFKQHTQTSVRAREAPFRVIVMHQPQWGWLSGDNRAAMAEWTTAANAAKVDLVIAGHRHRFSLTPAGGPDGNSYPILTVGQDQVAKVVATEQEIRVRVIGIDGATVTDFTVARRSR